MIEGYWVIIVQLLLGLIFIYFSSYSKEKGKNLATKEDIGVITKKVEEAKQTFIRENDNLRSELSLKTSILNSLKAEERNAIVVHLDNYTKLTVMISRFAQNNNTEIITIKHSIRECFHNLEMSRSRLLLFIKSDSIAKKDLKTSKDILEYFNNTWLNSMDKVMELYLEKESLLYELDRQKEFDIIDINRKVRVIIDKLTEQHKEFQSKSNQQISDLREDCRNYLYP